MLKKTFLNALYQSLDDTELLAQTVANNKNLDLVKHRTYQMVEWAITNFQGLELNINQFISKELNYLNTGNTASAKCYKVSTAELFACYDEAAKENDKLLNENYKKLKNNLNSDLQAKLKTAQKAWLKFRDDEIAVHTITGQILSTNLMRESQGFNADMIYRRAVELGEFANHAAEYGK